MWSEFTYKIRFYLLKCLSHSFTVQLTLLFSVPVQSNFFLFHYSAIIWIKNSRRMLTDTELYGRFFYNVDICRASERISKIFKPGLYRLSFLGFNLPNFAIFRMLRSGVRLASRRNIATGLNENSIVVLDSCRIPFTKVSLKPFLHNS